MNLDKDTSRFLIDKLKWLALYFGIGFVLISILHYPYDLVSVIVLFISINLWRGSNEKYGGISGIKDMLRMLSFENNRQLQLKYYCMSCGKEHRETACPCCGSKMKRVWLNRRQTDIALNEISAKLIKGNVSHATFEY